MRPSNLVSASRGSRQRRSRRSKRIWRRPSNTMTPVHRCDDSLFMLLLLLLLAFRTTRVFVSQQAQQFLQISTPRSQLAYVGLKLVELCESAAACSDRRKPEEGRGIQWHGTVRQFMFCLEERVWVTTVLANSLLPEYKSRKLAWNWWNLARQLWLVGENLKQIVEHDDIRAQVRQFF